MQYRRLTCTLSDKGILISSESNAFDYVKNTDKDWYLSVFKYNEEQKAIFSQTGTVAGITDTITDKLWFDFDSEFEPEAARKDALTLCERLVSYDINPKDIIISFSGNKGYGVELNLNQELTPKAVKTVAFELAQKLPTFDVKMYNASRILRLIGTKNQKTGLFKIPLTLNQLKELSTDAIMAMSKKVPDSCADFRWSTIDLPEELSINQIEAPNTREETKELIEYSRHLDYSAKPKFLTNCRWSIQNGNFKEGDRSTALLCLGSTYKNLGFDLEHVYRLLKGTAELQSKKFKQERFPDEEIYNNIALQVFSPTWKNGQYTCREKGNWLETYCNKLEHPCNHKEDDELKPKTFLDLKDDFKEYVKNIDKNTIYTGLPSIDKHVFLSTGANVVIVAAPGAGKTSIGLELLENTSRAGVRSVVASLDMAKNRIFEKVMYRLSGYSRDTLYKVFQENQEQDLLKKLQESYGNVNFFKKSSASVQDIKEYVLRCNEQNEDKVKLILIDYFERVNSEIGDDTAASKKVAGELQDLVDDLDVCLITLLQPNKAALFGGPDAAIYDYTKIKGSSFVYQAPRIIMSCWRPFYNPKDFSNDKYMQIAVLKNDLGELAEMQFAWEGRRGKISELEDYQRADFEYLLKQKELENQNDSNDFI